MNAPYVYTKDDMDRALATKDREKAALAARITELEAALERLQRAQRNLHPHAEARLAMALWSHEYAFEQCGGSMDFWDSRTRAQKRLCRGVVDGILEAAKLNGRARSEGESR